MCGCREQSIHLPTSTARFRLFSLSLITSFNPVIAQAIKSIPFAAQPCSNHLYHRSFNRCLCRQHTISIAPQVLPKITLSITSTPTIRHSKFIHRHPPKIRSETPLHRHHNPHNRISVTSCIKGTAISLLFSSCSQSFSASLFSPTST